MITDEYRHALRALKDQADAATWLLCGKSNENAKLSLASAERRIALFAEECNAIGALLRASSDSALTIDSMSEFRLAREIAAADQRLVDRERSQPMPERSRF